MYLNFQEIGLDTQVENTKTVLIIENQLIVLRRYLWK